jgi:ATP-dependent DNA helicase DinG
MCARLKSIFEYERREDFHEKLVEWIGDIFYDILPEYGYEVRDEQIYTAFQIADALCDKKIHLAEAGLGTGKTFAYLLSAIAYARLNRKPIIVACASTALQEQLCGENGDIKTLSDLLELEIDARMAKDSYQYVCDAKVEESKAMLDNLSEDLAIQINEWLGKTTRGERSEIPFITDQVWKYIGWDEGMSCDTCLDRGFCKLIKAKEFYRGARDIIVVDHELFFKDLWTREDRIADGKLPILPEYCGVIFDEGHKIILPASMEAGHSVIKDDIEQMILSIEQIHGARESLLLTAVQLEDVTEALFVKLDQIAIVDERSERFSVHPDDSLFKLVEAFQKVLDKLLLELQIEQELYMESLPKSLIQAYEMLIDRAMLAVHNFRKNKGKDIIAWIDPKGESFCVVPRHIDTRLNKHLFGKKIPVVLTSATLSNDGDFNYLIRTLGLKNPTHSSVGNSFQMDKQVEVNLPEPLFKDKVNVKDSKDIDKLVHLLKSNEGRALVLTNSLKEVRRIREGLKNYQLPFDILWEDKAERGYLIRQFKEETSSVLIGYDFWEGIDVPGESLTMVIIWQLPFPALDPLIEVQRLEAKREGLDELITVDYPAMGLKLKQGCGRLIRTKDDQGKIVIMDSVYGEAYEKYVMSALPEDANIRYIDELEL